MRVQEIIRIYMEMESIILSNNVIMSKGNKLIENLPRIYVHQYNNHYIAYFRNEMPENVKNTFFDISSETIWQDEKLIVSILETHYPCKKIGVDKNYYFSYTPQKSDFTNVEIEGSRFVIKIDNLIVSQAFSANENEFAADLGVETIEGFRRRGYGFQVASAWGNSIVRSNRLGFYIHDSKNYASERLAEKLRVKLFCSTKEYY